MNFSNLSMAAIKDGVAGFMDEIMKIPDDYSGRWKKVQMHLRITRKRKSARVELHNLSTAVVNENHEATLIVEDLTIISKTAKPLGQEAENLPEQVVIYLIPGNAGTKFTYQGDKGEPGRMGFHSSVMHLAEDFGTRT